jgi:hypothetical protein
MAEPLDERALVAKLRALSPERQEQVRAFVDFLVEQEAHRGDDPATPAVSESLSSQVRASVDAALRGGLAGPEVTPEDERQQKALEEIARRFSP